MLARICLFVRTGTAAPEPGSTRVRRAGRGPEPESVAMILQAVYVGA